MLLIPLGTAAATSSADEGTSAYCVEDAGVMIGLDAGDSVLRSLLQSGRSARLDALCITHGHPDHLSGCMALFRHWSVNQTEGAPPIPVYAPAPVLEQLRLVLRALDLEASGVVDLRPADARHSVTVKHLTVRPFDVAHDAPHAVGFRITTPIRPGTVDMARLRALGVSPGPHVGALKRGQPLTLPNGTVIHPADVVGPSQRGWSMAYTGDTEPASDIIESVRAVDLLLHDSTYAATDTALARHHHHSTATEAGQVAAAANAAQLLLTHVSHRYNAAERESLLNDARSVFAGVVDLAVSHSVWSIPHGQWIHNARGPQAAMATDYPVSHPSLLGLRAR